MLAAGLMMAAAAAERPPSDVTPNAAQSATDTPIQHDPEFTAEAVNQTVKAMLGQLFAGRKALSTVLNDYFKFLAGLYS